jgi:Xaa-Pro aminopeptidase
VPKRGAEVFAVVRAARDAVVQCAKAAWSAKERVQGWQLDETARTVISDAGFGQYIRHRTGHSLSPGPKVHGLGMNLDNLETHDTREMLPGIGYTIEPGVYLPEFGVRLEINVFVDPQQGPTITSVVQDEVVLITRGR